MSQRRFKPSARFAQRSLAHPDRGVKTRYERVEEANRSPVTACSIDFAKFHRTVELARVSDGNPATSEGAEEDTDALFFSHA